jgi:D-amino-acid dehydrogenase
MAGVGAALQLQARGWSVALVDKGEPGRETSYGNAGIIQSEAVEPYAMPRDWQSLFAIATRRSNDVHWDLGGLRQNLGSLLHYWWHSSPRRHAVAAEAYAGLIARAVPEHAALVTASGVTDLVRQGGFRVLLRTPRAMDEAAFDAERLQARYGVRSRAMSPAELAAAEPVLKQAGAGAIHWLDSWSASDPGALVAAYAELLRRRGGAVRTGDAGTLKQTPSGWSVQTAEGPLEAEAVIVALGPWSPEFLRRFGYRFPMVRKRGYHRHWRSSRAPTLPIVDAANGYVMAPMARGLRITTGAELSASDANPTPIQLARAERAAAELVDLGSPFENAPWSGTRPCMPDMLPVIGEAPRHQGLWLHFGHGHQGFTLGPATGRLLAEAMSGEAPFAPAAPFSPARFGP